MNRLILFASELLNPREHNENLGTLALGSRYFSDENIDDINEYIAGLLGIEDFDRLCSVAKIVNFYSDEMKEYLLERFEKDYIFHKVYKYEHGNIAFATSSFHCKWDSGLAGIIFVSKEDVRKEFGVKRITGGLKQRVLDILNSEVKCYHRFVNNEAVGFRIETENGDILDSCSGFDMHDDWAEDVASYIDNDLLLLNDEELLKLIKETEIEN